MEESIYARMRHIDGETIVPQAYDEQDFTRSDEIAAVVFVLSKAFKEKAELATELATQKSIQSARLTEVERNNQRLREQLRAAEQRKRKVARKYSALKKKHKKTKQEKAEREADIHKLQERVWVLEGQLP